MKRAEEKKKTLFACDRVVNICKNGNDIYKVENLQTTIWMCSKSKTLFDADTTTSGNMLISPSDILCFLMKVVFYWLSCYLKKKRRGKKAGGEYTHGNGNTTSRVTEGPFSEIYFNRENEIYKKKITDIFPVHSWSKFYCTFTSSFSLRTLIDEWQRLSFEKSLKSVFN